MNIVPTRSRSRSSRSTAPTASSIGIIAGIAALWSIYRVFWLFYTAAMYSSVGWSPVSLVFPLVLWGTFSVGAGFVSAVYLLRTQATLNPR